jgi:hypothetical protein
LEQKKQQMPNLNIARKKKNWKTNLQILLV